VDLDEVPGAVRALADEGRVDEALDLIGSLSVAWQDGGRIDEGREITESTLSAVGPVEGAAAGRAWLVLGELAFRQGDQETARSASQRAASLAGRAGDHRTQCRALVNLARTEFRDANAEGIAEYAHAALRIADEQSDDSLRTGPMHMLGWAAYTAGDLATAVTRFEDNAALYQRVGNTIGEASEYANIADLAMESGDLDRARPALRRAFDVPGAAESSYLAPSLVRSAGVLCGLAGDAECAARLLLGADAVYARLGLLPDPGDDVSPRVLATALETVGAERERHLRSEAVDVDLASLVAVARDAL
jgi:tetratricopeptide (TPR) repeat protein